MRSRVISLWNNILCVRINQLFQTYQCTSFIATQVIKIYCFSVNLSQCIWTKYYISLFYFALEFLKFEAVLSLNVISACRQS